MSKISTFRAYDISNAIKIQSWFVGFITKSSVERFLKKESEYLVHTEEKDNCLRFVLSVRSKKQCHHYTLINKDKLGWTLDAEPKITFGTIIDLIHYYENHVLPMGDTFLVHPFEKPKWFIRHQNVAYNLERGLIGTGNFSDVYEGKLCGKISVALKVCHGPTGESSNLEDAKEALVREACLMSQFKHPNIVKFFGICYDVPSICVIMEQCTGGSLDNHLQQWAYKITIGERILYGLETAKGMCYLQGKDLIHRDLATRNCLISKYGVIKISDFGLSLLANDHTVIWKKQKVPIRWMAPETIQHKPLYSFKSDVWSYGVLLYEIFNNGIKPWPNLDVRQCATNIRRGIMPDMPEITPKEIIRLVKKCWKISVEKRCDFKYIVKKLKKLQLCYAPPEITDLTIAKLKNVKALTEEGAETQEEKDDCEVELITQTVIEGTSTGRWITDSTTTHKKDNTDEASSVSDQIEKNEELERKRKREDDLAILNEAILEYVAAEIEKLLASKRKHKRRHKSRKKLDRKHRRSRRSSESSFIKEDESSPIKKSSRDSRESKTQLKESEALSKDSGSSSAKDEAFFKEKEKSTGESEISSNVSDMQDSSNCQTNDKLMNQNKESQNEDPIAISNEKRSKKNATNNSNNIKNTEIPEK
uniref:Tyrosine-protein kinase n=2 Tax=Wuchereria bancrofti TaxID=6293 RepID=A0AAF5PNR3_WUCBA